MCISFSQAHKARKHEVFLGLSSFIHVIPQPDEFYRYRHGVVMATTQMPGTDDDAQSTGRVRVRQRMKRGQEEVERGKFRVGHEMESFMRNV